MKRMCNPCFRVFFTFTLIFFVFPPGLLPAEDAIPENATPQEYEAFLRELYTRKPGESPVEFMKGQKARKETGAKVAAKIMAHPDTPDDLYLVAATMRLAALDSRLDSGDETAIPEMKAILREAEESGRKNVAKQLAEMIVQTELGFAAERGEEAFLAVVRELNARMTAKEKPSEEDFALAHQAARIAEHFIGHELAAAMNLGYSAFFDETEEFKERAKLFRKAAHRLSLVGNEMIVAGKLLDGTVLDMDAKKGKVVLVEFWATWCHPCVKEMPYVQRLYEAYHEKGLEIVGVSLDKDVDVLKAFLEQRKIPWENMLDTDTEAEGLTMWEYYAAEGIPTMILIGRNGKVISTNARDVELKRLLEEQLGAMPEEL